MVALWFQPSSGAFSGPSEGCRTVQQHQHHLLVSVLGTVPLHLCVGFFWFSAMDTQASVHKSVTVVSSPDILNRKALCSVCT